MKDLRRKIQVDPRIITQSANLAIKGDLVRALVELITNSDDSYRRLEANGTPSNGIIDIKINRKKGIGTIVRVTDNAEGFDYDKMDESIATYAKDTSGFTSGKSVRGYFGRGLKDAILCLGKGCIKSILEKYYSECVLDEKYYTPISEEPMLLNSKEKLNFEKLSGIKYNGTEVTITVTKKHIKIPQYDNLTENLEKYFSLRDILTSKKRTVFISEMDNSGKSKCKKQKLEYKHPVSTPNCEEL